MPTFTRANTITADGDTFTQQDSVTGGESAKVQLTLEAGIAGTLTTRTSNSAGVVTVAAHTFTATVDYCSIFWTDPTTGADMCRQNIPVTATTSTTVTVSGGQGDNLPLLNATCIISKVNSRLVAWDGTTNGMLGFAAGIGNRRGSITAQAVGTLVGLAGTDLIKQLKTSSPGYSWLSGVDGAFAFTGNILFLTAALGDTNGAGVATFKRLDT